MPPIQHLVLGQLPSYSSNPSTRLSKETGWHCELTGRTVTLKVGMIHISWMTMIFRKSTLLFQHTKMTLGQSTMSTKASWQRILMETFQKVIALPICKSKVHIKWRNRMGKGKPLIANYYSCQFANNTALHKVVALRIAGRRPCWICWFSSCST